MSKSYLSNQLFAYNVYCIITKIMHENISAAHDQFVFTIIMNLIITIAQISGRLLWFMYSKNTTIKIVFLHLHGDVAIQFKFGS
jgi:hypothetical protein